jgi:hypothetical protein
LNLLAKKLTKQCLWLVLAVSPVWAASPCDGVDRSLTKERKETLAPVIAKQLNVKRVDVLQSFRYAKWSIIYIDNHESDNGFLIYSGDPLRSHYITVWGGVALPKEEQEIRKWTIKNAAGIPPRLAGCFAWHVTNDRDK